VLQGTLQIGNGGTSSILGNVTDDAALVFDRSDILTFAGTVTGTGSVAQSDSGKLILSAANTYSGGTILSHGVLTVGGPQALGTGNMLVNGGILRADLQPINVKGNCTQTAGGTFRRVMRG
jgi:fibronectin-binding autotransporter adhesin